VSRREGLCEHIQTLQGQDYRAMKLACDMGSLASLFSAMTPDLPLSVTLSSGL
jgi:hypothetical protein